MRAVFADTFYWLALIDTHDAHHAAARSAMSQCIGVRVVTTESVLVELFAALSGRGPLFRRAAVGLAEALKLDTDAEVIPQSSELFAAGAELYGARPDKQYSLTDCISMYVMRERRIAEVLTHDHHFAQEGFTLLL
jgi:predicted nucleic acid-binding protein